MLTSSLLMFSLLAGCGSSSGEEAHSESAPTGPVKVTTVEVRDVDVPVVVDAMGAIAGDREARVAAGATGRVIDVRIERGSVVKKGEVMVVFDDRLLSASREEARAAVAQSEANLKVADDDCQRAQALFDKGLSNDAALIKAKATCAGAKATLDSAKARLQSADIRVGDTRLRAPFDGIISERLVSPGEYVRDDSGVATLVGISDLRLEVTIGERDSTRIVGGESVRFRVAGDTIDRLAIVDRISPLLRDKGRDLVVEARIVEDSAKGLRPGAFVRAGIETAAQRAVAVPATAVKTEGSAHRAYVVREGRIEERIVAIGTDQGGELSILDGIRSGEKVVAPIPDDIRDGAPALE